MNPADPVSDPPGHHFPTQTCGPGGCRSHIHYKYAFTARPSGDGADRAGPSAAGGHDGEVHVVKLLGVVVADAVTLSAPAPTVISEGLDHTAVRSD